MFVPRVKGRMLTAASTCLRSSVGGVTRRALLLKATTPILIPFGSVLTKVRTAFLAASMRLGAMSMFRIEPETSIARMTTPLASGVSIVALGRAAATTRAASVRT
jgi:hypothetical protein